jgi:PilZ domain
MQISSGRGKKRIAKELVMNLVRPDGSRLERTATTENISDHGMRLVTDHVWTPGDIVLLKDPKTGHTVQGRIVYCQKQNNKQFALGLELSTPLSDATKSN